MAAKTDDINKKAAKLAEKQTEKGKEMQQYEEVRSQLQTIMSEQQNNLALEKQDMGNQAQLTETLSQAGAMAAAGGVGGGIAAQPQVVGPSTAETLQKFGMKPGTTVTHGHNVQIQPNKITVNNTYNNTTTNNISNGAGPLQGRPVQIAAATNTEAQSQARFKTWLSNLFAQQKEANQKRSKEYEKREWSLTRSANKMLRKMEATGKNVMDAFNPQRFGQTVGSQLKVLMTLFAIKFLAKNWDKIIKIAGNIVKFVKDGISYFGIGQEGERRRREGTDFRGDLIWFLTGDRKKARDGKTSLMGVLKDIFKSFGEYAKLWFEEQMKLRGAAIKSIQKPTFSWTNINDSIAGLGSYLADILHAIVSPTSAAESQVNKNIAAQAANSSAAARQREGTNMFNRVTDNTMAGDYALEQGGKKRYTLLDNALDGAGRLREGSASATISQGNDVLGAYNDAKNYGAVDIGRVYAGINRLIERARSDGNVILDGEFIDRMFGPGAKASGKFQPVKMKYIKAENDQTLNELQDSYTGLHSGNILERAGEGALMGAGIGAFAEGVGAAPGAIVGGAVGTVTALGETAIHGLVSDDYHLKLVPADDPKYRDVPPAIFNGQATVAQDYYRVKPEDLQLLLDRFDPNRTQSKDVIFANIQNDLVHWGGGQAAVDRRYNLSGRVAGFGRQYMTDTNAAMKNYREIESIRRDYSTRRENSEFMAYMNGMGDRTKMVGNYVWNQAGQLLNSGLELVGLRPTKITNRQQQQNSIYAMDYLTKKGMTPTQAAGVVGNLIAESGVNPSNGARDTNGLWSGGLAMWNGGNFTALKAYADRKGKPWNNMDLQLDYLFDTFMANRDVRDRMAVADTTLKASDAWAYYEKYAGYNYSTKTARQAGWSQGRINQEHANRANNAEGVLQLWNTVKGQEGGVQNYISTVPEGGYGYTPNNTAAVANLSLTPTTYAQSSNYVSSVALGSSTFSPISSISDSTGGIGGGSGYTMTTITSRGGGESITGGDNNRIALVGDSWAVGMSSTWGQTDTFARVGATVREVAQKVSEASSKGYGHIVVYVGLNSYQESEQSLTAGYEACINNAGGSKIYLCTLINVKEPNCLRATPKINGVIRGVAARREVGLIDLNPSSPNYQQFIGEAGQNRDASYHMQPRGYAELVKEIRSLLGGGHYVPSVHGEQVEIEKGMPGGDMTQNGNGYYTYYGGGGNGLGEGIYSAIDNMATGQLFDVGTSEEILATQNQGMANAEALQLLARAKETGFIYNSYRPVYEADHEKHTIRYAGEEGWDLGKFINDYDPQSFMEFWSTLSDEEKAKFKKKLERHLALYSTAQGIESNRLVLDGSTMTGNVDARNAILDKVGTILGKSLYNGTSTSIGTIGQDGKINVSNDRRARLQGEIYNLLLSGRYDEADELARNGRSSYSTDDTGFGIFDLNGRDTIDGHEHGEDSREYFYKTLKYGMLHGDDYLNLVANIQDLARRIEDSDNESEKNSLQLLLNNLTRRRDIYESYENNWSATAGDSPETAAAVMDYNRQHASAQVRLLDLQDERAKVEKNLRAAMDSMPLTEWYNLYEQQIGAIDKEIESVQLQIKNLEGASEEEIEEFRIEQQRHAEWMAASKEDLDGIFDAIDINDENYWMDVQNLYEKYGKSALDRLGVTKDELKEVMDTYENEALKTYTAEQRLLYVRLEKFKAALEKAERIAAATTGTDYEMSASEVYSAMTGTNIPGVDRYQATVKLGRAQKGLGIDVAAGTMNGQPLPSVDRSSYTGAGSMLMRNNVVADEAVIASAAGYSGYNGNQTLHENITSGNIGSSGNSYWTPSGTTNSVDWSKPAWSVKKAEGGWTGEGPANQEAFREGGNVFHMGEYVINKRMAHDPKWRPVIDSMEDERKQMISSYRIGTSRVKEPIDYTSQMIGKQDVTNELLGLIAKSNAEGLAQVAQVFSRAGQPPAFTPPVSMSKKHSYE